MLQQIQSDKHVEVVVISHATDMNETYGASADDN